MTNEITFATPMPTSEPPQKMRVISLWQPWASLCVTGKKTYETRPRGTKVRGTVLVHATQTIPSFVVKSLNVEKPITSGRAIQRALREAELTLAMLPLGAIVGQVDIVRMLTTEAWTKEKEVDDPDSIRWSREYWLGDYDPGRWAWELANPVLFKQPILAKGSQGFWSFDVAPYQHVVPL